MRKILAAFALAACLVPALAFAANPAKNASFQYCKSEDNCPLRFKTNKGGGKLVNLSMYNNCAQLPVNGFYPKVAVNDEGKFSKSGTVTDVIGQQLQFKIQGKFKKPGKAVGTYDIDRQGCSAQPTEFVAKRVEQ
jgi:hypothetical protein